jgi:protein-tyrosine phosphatase
MSPARRVLFVCTGNLCRSAMAEHLLRHLSQTRGLDLEVRSCGTEAAIGSAVPGVVHRLLSQAGVPPFEHAARLVAREHLRWADLVLAMTAAQAEELAAGFPEFGAKIRLLREQAGDGALDIADPMGGPEEAFVGCLAAISDALESLIRRGFRDPEGA